MKRWREAVRTCVVGNIQRPVSAVLRFKRTPRNFPRATVCNRAPNRPLLVSRPASRMSAATERKAEASLTVQASASTNVGLHMSLEDFRKEAHKMVDFMVDYQQEMQKGELPVRSQVKPGYLAPQLPDKPPEEPEEWDAILSDVRSKIVPGVTHWQHPSFFAYYPANSSGPGMIGEMASALFNTIGFSWICSPALTELETITVDWLRHALALPETFSSSGKGGGVIQSTASESVLVALLAARSRAWKLHQSKESDFHTFSSKLRAYVSDQAHSSVVKAFQVAGIPQAQCHTLPTAAADCYAFPAEQLSVLIDADLKSGLIPFFACATVGTTTSAAMDPVDRIGSITSRHSVWLHVDAAYAGSACICPEYRPLLNGVELADSFNFNAHKWLLTNFDCSPMWVKDRSALLDALGSTAEYLRNRQTETGLVYDYKDWQVPLGRRFRALKLWFVLRAYGLKKLREHIRSHVQFASHFARNLLEDERFELVVPQSLSLVCFRLTDKALGLDTTRADHVKKANELHLELLEAINGTGDVFMVHSSLDKRAFVRFVCGAPATRLQHIDAAVRTIMEQTNRILAKESGAESQSSE